MPRWCPTRVWQGGKYLGVQVEEDEASLKAEDWQGKHGGKFNTMLEKLTKEGQVSQVVASLWMVRSKETAAVWQFVSDEEFEKAENKESEELKKTERKEIEELKNSEDKVGDEIEELKEAAALKIQAAHRGRTTR